MENVRNKTKTVPGFSNTNSIKYKEFELNSNVIVYELMLRLYTEFSLKKTRFVIINFFQKLLFVLKRKFYFYFVSFICPFFNSETSLSFSSLTGEICVKTQNFDSYDVIMT